MNDIIYILEYLDIRQYCRITNNHYGNELIHFLPHGPSKCLWYPYNWEENVSPF